VPDPAVPVDVDEPVVPVVSPAIPELDDESPPDAELD
jgi:hypothetical protein